MTEKNQNKQEHSKAAILDAIDSCRNEIISNPENTTLYIKLAELYELNDNQEEAIYAYQTDSKISVYLGSIISVKAFLEICLVG